MIMKKIFIIAAIVLIVIVGIFITQNHKIVDSNLVNSQKNKVISFYESNKSSINAIKNYLWNKNYTIIQIESNGNAILEDGVSVYLSDILTYITQIYNDCEELKIHNISFGTNDLHSEKEFRIENFFKENNVEIDIVYSETGFPGNNMYILLEDNWYLFIAPMT